MSNDRDTLCDGQFKELNRRLAEMTKQRDELLAASEEVRDLQLRVSQAAIEELERQRDELLAACEALIADVDHTDCCDLDPVAMARAAIQKVKDK